MQNVLSQGILCHNYKKIVSNLKTHLQVTTNRIKCLRMMRTTNLIFVVLVINKPTNVICRSRNGEARVLNLKKRFLFEDPSDCVLTSFFLFSHFLVFSFFLAICQRKTNLNKPIQLLYVYLMIQMSFENMMEMSDVKPLICPFRTFLILKPNFKRTVLRHA